MRKLLLLALAIALVAGCSGGAGTPPPGSSPEHKTARKGFVHLVVRIPRRHRHRHARYISPSTQSMTIAVTGPTNVSQTFNLTPASPGCAASGGINVCTETLALLPGNYVATLTMFDGTYGNGNLLSTGQNVTFGVTEGVTNNLAIALSGVPAKLTIAPASSSSVQNGTSIDLIGAGAHPMIVQAFDADNNIIAGVGAPSFTVGQIAGSLAPALVQPTQASPNTFTVTLANNQAFTNGTATLQVTASYRSGYTNACAVTGAICQASQTFDMRQMLVVSNFSGPGSVTLYPANSSTLLGTLGNDGALTAPAALAHDANNDLFVGNTGTAAVAFYASPLTSGETPSTIATTSTVVSQAMAANQTLLAATSGDINVVVPPYATAADNSNVIAITTLAFDAGSNAFLGGSGLFELTSPYTGSAASLFSGTLSRVNAVAVDLSQANGNVAFAGVPIGAGPAIRTSYRQPHIISRSVWIAAAPYTSVLFKTGTDVDASTQLLFDAQGDLWVSDFSGNVINEYAPPFSGGAAVTISSGLSGPSAMAFDAAGNLYVANANSSAVTEYAAPLTSGETPSVTITDGVHQPEGLAFIPQIAALPNRATARALRWR